MVPQPAGYNGGRRRCRLFFTEEIMEMDWREETLESLLAYFNKNPKGTPWADIAVYYPAGEVLSAILKKAAKISEK